MPVRVENRKGKQHARARGHSLSGSPGGKGYRFSIENARDSTLVQVTRQHAGLTKNIVDEPMELRERPAE